MTLHLEVITPERRVYEDDVDMVVVPALDGYVGILPHHAPLLTALGHGEMRIKKGSVELPYAVFGGFMDVRAGRVTILTDASESAEEIDEHRAREARDQAQREIQVAGSAADELRARAALQQALIRLRVAERRRRR